MNYRPNTLHQKWWFVTCRLCRYR